MHFKIIKPLACVTAFLDGREFAEHHFSRLWSVNENAHNSLNRTVYLITYTFFVIGRENDKEKR